ncbi:hypothetical protein niasHT_014181 [Heterodera trifolii]|uniref:BTB domain-containing protein n=1 Tax=Heterodera trifolii TaxID=157864 RepID=A0ABD2KXD1_9BILA
MSSALPSFAGNLNERMKHLLSTGEEADVQFSVGEGEGKELLLAHKVFLMSASDEFEKMFINEKADASADSPVIDVPDVEAAAFKVMLNFIYSDELSELRGDNAMAVLYAAKKYNISSLIDQCLQIPIQSMPNVFLAYAQARLFELENFARQCLRYICQNAGSLFGSEEFLQIDQNLLCGILERDQLLINDEFAIWKAALHWADEKCKNATECSAGNRRAALGSALFKIRFPLIALETFGKEIVPSGVLSKDEVIGVYQFHCHPNFHGVPGQYPLKFPYKSRICDWNIAKGNRGTLAMQIEKLSEFMQEEVGSSRKSDVEVHIKGMPWKIESVINKENESTEKSLCFFLLSTASEEDENWSCICSASLRIVSQMSGTEDLIGQFNNQTFNSKITDRGFDFITLKNLMDPNSRGLYDEEEDKLTLAIDIFVEEQKMDKFVSDPNKSTGKIVLEIGKWSEFAREIFESSRRSETIQIKGIPWKIMTDIKRKKEGTEKWLGFYLENVATVNDENWCCNCSANFRIVSQKKGAEDFNKEFEGCFKPSSRLLGFENFITFTELMDPIKGFYDENGDKITLAID